MLGTFQQQTNQAGSPPPIPEFRSSDYGTVLQLAFDAAETSLAPEYRLIEDTTGYSTLTLTGNLEGRIIHLSTDGPTPSIQTIEFDAASVAMGEMSLVFETTNAIPNYIHSTDATNHVNDVTRLNLSATGAAAFNTISEINGMRSGTYNASAWLAYLTLTDVNASTVWANATDAPPSNYAYGASGASADGSSGGPGTDGASPGESGGVGETGGVGGMAESGQGGDNGQSGTGDPGTVVLLHSATIGTLYCKASSGTDAQDGGPGGNAAGGSGGSGGNGYDDSGGASTPSSGGNGGDGGNGGTAGSGGTGGTGGDAATTTRYVQVLSGCTITNLYRTATGGQAGNGGNGGAAPGGSPGGWGIGYSGGPNGSYGTGGGNGTDGSAGSAGSAGISHQTPLLNSGTVTNDN